MTGGREGCRFGCGKFCRKWNSRKLDNGSVHSLQGILCQDRRGSRVGDFVPPLLILLQEVWRDIENDYSVRTPVPSHGHFGVEAAAEFFAVREKLLMNQKVLTGFFRGRRENGVCRVLFLSEPVQIFVLEWLLLLVRKVRKSKHAQAFVYVLW